MMIGCHFDHSRRRFGGFSGGEYDELALWNRKLESDGGRDETVYFLGGASSIGYANVTPDQVIFADLYIQSAVVQWVNLSIVAKLTIDLKLTEGSSLLDH